MAFRKMGPSSMEPPKIIESLEEAKFDDPEQAFPDYDPVIGTGKNKIYNPDVNAENRFKQTNMIKVRPKGWLIMDSFNNKAFPMDFLRVDTMQFDTEKLQKWFHQRYGGSQKDLFLPWHWVIEIINGKPFVMQTRPPMYKSNVPGFANHFTIMLIGDGNQDIYPGSLYRQMGHMIINPWKFMQGVRMPNNKSNFTFQVGKNFNKDYLFNQVL